MFLIPENNPQDDNPTAIPYKTIVEYSLSVGNIKIVVNMPKSIAINGTNRLFNPSVRLATSVSPVVKATADAIVIIISINFYYYLTEFTKSIIKIAKNIPTRIAVSGTNCEGIFNARFATFVRLVVKVASEAVVIIMSI